MILSFLNKYREGGIFLLRLGIGILLVGASLPIVAGGSAKWHLAAGMLAKTLHLTSHLNVWGGIIAFSELIGGVLLIVGLLFRLVCLFMIVGATLAAVVHL